MGSSNLNFNVWGIFVGEWMIMGLKHMVEFLWDIGKCHGIFIGKFMKMICSLGFHGNMLIGNSMGYSLKCNSMGYC